MRWRCCRASSGITASRLPIRRRSRPITSSELARRHVTVALNGDGGDECFLGYQPVPGDAPSRPRSTGCRAGAAQRWRGCSPLAPPDVQRRLRLRADPRRARGAAQRSRRSAMPRRSRSLPTATRSEGYGEAMRGFSSRLRRSTCWSPILPRPDSLVGGANWADIHTYLPDDLMVKVDVASMAHGLEARSPLLDHVLLEWAARIPGRGQDGRRGHQGAVQVGDGALSAARGPVPAKEWVRLPDRPLVSRTSCKDWPMTRCCRRARAQRGLLRPDYVTPPARRALRVPVRPPDPAVGAVDARIVVPDVDRRAGRYARYCGLRLSRPAPAEGLLAPGGSWSSSIRRRAGHGCLPTAARRRRRAGTARLHGRDPPRPVPPARPSGWRARPSLPSI